MNGKADPYQRHLQSLLMRNLEPTGALRREFFLDRHVCIEK